MEANNTLSDRLEVIEQSDQEGPEKADDFDASFLFEGMQQEDQGYQEESFTEEVVEEESLDQITTNTSRSLYQNGWVGKKCYQYSTMGIEKFGDRKTTGWDSPRLAEMRQLGYFLGPFYNKESTAKVYQLPRHGGKLPSMVTLQFFFYEMGAWAGQHDTLYVVINERGNKQFFHLGRFWEHVDEGDRSGTHPSGITWQCMTSMTPPGHFGNGADDLDQSHLIMVQIPQSVYKRDGYLKVRFFVAANSWRTPANKKSGGFDNIIVKARFPCNMNYIKSLRGWPNKPSQSSRPFFNAKEEFGHYIPPPDYRLKALGSLQFAGNWHAFEHEMEFIMHRAMTDFIMKNFNGYMGNCLYKTFPGITVDLVRLPPGAGQQPPQC